MSATAPATGPGLEQLFELVEHAVGFDTVDATVDCIKSNLCRLIRGGVIDLPEHYCRPVDNHYARRLLKRDDELGYSIVAMTWGPGQRTAIHDHCGMWCVEGVWAGSISVQQYELAEHENDRFRFEKRNSYEAGRGSAGCLIPPYEYHHIENGCAETPAVSLHIYGGEMQRCNVFEDAGGGWYRRVEKPLGYDN